MSKKLFFNFYGVKVEVSSSWDEILERLEKDFSYFVTEANKLESSNIELNLEIKREKLVTQESRKFSYKSSKVSFYEEDGERRCDYFNKVRSGINFKNHTAWIKGEDHHSVHEVGYLMILSRVGKALDLKGIHRLHAGAFEKDGVLFLALLPSGGGKSTLLSSIMKGDDFNFFSDDSPLIKSSSTILPFPIRVGFSEGSTPNELEGVPSYPLKRFRFGIKNLFSLKDLNWPVGSDYKSIVLISGKRGEKADFHNVLGLSHLIHMIKEGVIGFGLPILYEYFWEYGCGDFWIKTKIALSRMRVMFGLWLKAKKYQVTLESDLDKNKIMLESLVKEERD